MVKFHRSRPIFPLRRIELLRVVSKQVVGSNPTLINNLKFGEVAQWIRAALNSVRYYLGIWNGWACGRPTWL